MQKKSYAFLIFLGFFSLVIFYLSPLLVPHFSSIFDNFSSQISYILTSKKEVARNIVIVEIDTESLKKINKKWPLNRSLYAKALDILRESNAKVVALDIIFQGEGATKQEDQDLRVALSKFRNKVILASYISKNNNIILPLKRIIRNTQTGFVNAIKDKGGRVRKLRSYFKVKNSSYFSLAVQSVSAFYDAQPQIEGNFVSIKDKKIPFGRNGAFSINYILKPDDFTIIPIFDLLNQDFPEGLFAGKIVLIGATAEIVHDISATPLGQMPGVFVQANGIANILNENYCRSLPGFISFLILIIVLIAIGLIVSAFPTMQGFFLYLGVLFGTLWIDIFFRLFAWQLEYTTFFSLLPLSFFDSLSYGSMVMASSVFFFVGNVYNYVKFLSMILQIKSKTTIDPFSQLFKLSFFYERLRAELACLHRRRCYLAVVVLDGFSLSCKEKSFEHFKKIWSKISLFLFDSASLWARCSEDIIVGVKRGEIDLTRLREDFKAIFFEQDIKVNIKIGYVQIDSSTSIRDALPFMTESLQKGEEELKLFNKKDLPSRAQHKLKGEDPITSLYSDVEEKNQELLATIRKLREEEKKTQEAYLQLVSSLVNALESKDPYAEGHTKRVSRYALYLVDKLELSFEEKEKVKKASLLHDLGKIGIPDAILQKKGKLTDEEFAFIKEHEVLSVKILEHIKQFENILPYILYHHESFDGSGYPHGLAGDFIPLGARIIAIADVFDALSTGRSYKEAYSIERSVRELQKMKGGKLDPVLVDKFIEVLTEQHINNPRKK